MADILSDLFVLSRELEKFVKIILEREPCKFGMQPPTATNFKTTTQRKDKFTKR